MSTIPLPVDAATTADDAADYLVQMHRLRATADLVRLIHQTILEDRKDRRR